MSEEIMKPDHTLLKKQAARQVQGEPYSNLAINMDEGFKVTGIHFSCPLGYEKQVLDEVCKNLKFPVTITMPCKCEFIVNAREALQQNMPCSCGNPNHWFIKWDAPFRN